MEPTMITMPFLMPISTNRRRTPKMGMHFSTKLYIDTENLYEELRRKHVKQKIIHKKIRRPVEQSQWVIDFFEEIEYIESNLVEEKKRKILKLRIREPVESSQWNDENEWCCIHDIMENLGNNRV